MHRIPNSIIATLAILVVLSAALVAQGSDSDPEAVFNTQSLSLGPDASPACTFPRLTHQ